MDRPASTVVTTRRAAGGLVVGRQLAAGEGNAVGGHGWDGTATSASDGTGIRVSLAEAGVLQSFPTDYPWQGRPINTYEQAGNAVPPRLALHVLAAASGLSVPTATLA
jgi:site-specific DNA-cytosine methylase